MASLPKVGPLYTLGDANAQLGSIASKHVGTYCPEVQSSNGYLFHTFLKSISSFVPNTFAQCCNGNSVLTLQNKKRVDYVSVPVSTRVELCSAGTCPVLDGMAPEADHMPTYVKLEVASDQKVQWVRRKVQMYDLSQTLSPPAAKQFSCDLAEQVFESVPAGSNEAVCTFTNHVHNCLSNYFPKVSPKYCTNNHISDRTRSMVKRRNARIELIREVKHNHQVRSIADTSPFFQLVVGLRRLNKKVVSSVNADRAVFQPL